MRTVSVSAIVPFYNEGGRILAVLDILRRLRGVDEIICVDDGSTDQATPHIRESFPDIIVLENPSHLALPQRRGQLPLYGTTSSEREESRGERLL